MALTQEQVAAMIAELEKKGGDEGENKPNNTSAPSPVSIVVNGETKTFNDPQALQHYLDTDYRNSVIQSQPNNNRQLPGTTVTGDDKKDDGAWTDSEKNEFAALFIKNPAEGLSYADKKRFGLDNPVEALKQTMNVVQGLLTATNVQQFYLNNPEFERTPDNQQKLFGALSNARLAPTPENLSLVFNAGKSQGVFGKSQPARQQNSTILPPPVPHGGSSDAGNEEEELLARADKLDDKNLRKLIESMMVAPR